LVSHIREEYRLRLFENRVLRRPNRDEVMGERSKLHSGELHNLYLSLNIVRVIKSRGMRWVGHVACMGEERKMYSILVGKPIGKRPLRRLRCKWGDGIRMDFGQTGWEDVEWIHVAQDRDWWWAVVNMAMNLQVVAPWI
jgi:hypothetical protein